MRQQTLIACLPVAGKENPYQLLMMKGLSDAGFNVYNGHPSRFTGIIRTAVKRPDYIHFDWETNYYRRRSLWMTLLNIPFFILQVLFARFIFGCKIVWTPHNITPHENRDPGIHRFCRRFFASQVQWIRVFSKISIPRFKAELKCEDSKFRVLPEGSYLGYYPDSTNRKFSREKLRLMENDKVFLCLGYIKPYKGITELIEAFKLEFTTGEKLLIVGKVMDQSYYDAVKRIANNNVVIEDRFVADEELQYYMHASDVVVLPFKKVENSGSVILAMGFEKPVIAPDMGVITERLKGQSSLLYKDNIAESFNVVKKMDSAGLTKIGMDNRKAVEQYKWIDFGDLFKQSC